MNQHNKEIEDAILGALLLESFRMPTVAAIIKEEYFYSKQNQYVFRAIKQLYDANETIDILTVTQKLNKMGRLQEIGGAYYVSTLTNRIASGNNIEVHSRLVHQFYILRELTILGNEITQESQAQNADCFDIIEKLQKKAQSLTTLVSTSVKHVGDIFADLLKDIKEVQKEGKPTGVFTGLKRLDNYTGGWQKGNLILLAARPGMGKTMFALQAAKYPAIHLNKPTAIFSLEMTALELVGRLASSESDTNSTIISQKTINEIELQRMTGKCMKLVDAPLYIDDTPSLSLNRLKSIAIKMVYEYGVELIIIDYLQLMSGDGKGNREQEISSISRGLKGLAKELNIPIIALSQLSREVEKRPDKRPMLSDLRESGSLEQDADIVMFLWRPEYYDLNPEGYGYKNHTLATQNLMMADIAKGRAIQVGELPLKFYGQFMRVENYDLPDDVITTTMSNNNNFLTDL